MCTPCPIAGQWSPTQSVDAADCMTIPQAAVSEVCQSTPPQRFGESKFAKCRLRYSLQDLYDAHDNKTLSFRMGSLDELTVAGVFETWFCVKDDPCATDLTDNHFCYVYHETEQRFVPWGPNPSLKLLILPVSQDEVLHLRAAIDTQAAELAQLKKVVANLTGN